MIIGNPSSGIVNQSHGASCALVISCVVHVRGSGEPVIDCGMSLAKASSMLSKHLLMVSSERAASSALFPNFSSSGKVDLKIRPVSFSLALNWVGFLLVPLWRQELHLIWDGGNFSVVQSLLHDVHCVFIAVEYALNHHPFLVVLWSGHIFFRNLRRS